jgi:hypothetical protein
MATFLIVFFTLIFVLWCVSNVLGVDPIKLISWVVTIIVGLYLVYGVLYLSGYMPAMLL